MRLTRNKYGATKKTIDNIVFDSKLEASRYLQLKMLQQAGEITHLRMHTRWPLVVGGKKVCAYESDFDYKDIASGFLVVEDCKGMRTRLYSLKKKLFEAIMAIPITEIPAKKSRVSVKERGVRL